MSIEAILWDLGGVILRTEDRTPREQLADRLGMTYEELSRLIFDSQSSRLATLGEITTEEHWESVRMKLGISEDEFPRVPREFWGGDSLDEDLMAYIQSLRPRYSTALLSNAWDDLREALREDWGIIDDFDHIIISSEVGLAKPDRRIYRLALDRVGVEAEEAVFIDDFPENVASAREVGLHAIHFQDPQETLDELKALLTKVTQL